MGVRPPAPSLVNESAAPSIRARQREKVRFESRISSFVLVGSNLSVQVMSARHPPLVAVQSSIVLSSIRSPHAGGHAPSQTEKPWPIDATAPPFSSA